MSKQSDEEELPVEVNINRMEDVKSFLRKLFQFDAQDLDFGIYRIMNCKRNEIERFIEKDLVETAKEEFAEFFEVGNETLNKELEQLKKEINRDFGEGTIDDREKVTRNYEAPKIKEYLLKKHEISKVEIAQDQINDVFNNVIEFFSRYYIDGDFISKRRYGSKNKYYVPYNGEEVTLYWANRDQYYVKTDEFFNKYNFKVGKFDFHFILSQTDTSTINRAEKRYFILAEGDSIAIDENSIKLFFDYRPLSVEEKSIYGSKDIQAEIVSTIEKEFLAKIGSGELYNSLSQKVSDGLTVLSEHISRYVKRNTSDYFIHKNLKLFLLNELDFYIKNELLDLQESLSINIDFLTAKKLKIKVFRNISNKIIDFLSQIEGFELSLFEKRKFIISSDYLMTINSIKPEFLEIISKNEKQVESWKKLYKLDITTRGTLYDTNGKKVLDTEFLKANPHLVIDTKLFERNFKDELVASFDPIEDQTNALIVKSENFQALNLLFKRYENKVKCIYIDPPYNTGEDGFVYKDDYQDSSWLSLMSDRIALAWKFLRDDGVIFVSCDFHESANLLKTMEQICGKESYVATFYIKVRHEGRILLGDKEVQEVIENVICFKKPNFQIKKTLLEENLDEYRFKIIEKTNNPQKIVKGGKEVKIFKEGEYDILQVESNTSLLKRISVRGTIRKGNSSGRFYVGFIENRYSPGTLFKVSNIGDDGLGYRYFHIPEGVKNGVYFQGRPLTQEQREKPYPTFYDMVGIFNTVGYEGDIDFKNGKKPVEFIQKLLEIADVKPTDIVLDFFAGSGSTGEAIIKLNEQDGGNRKFILVEMADYFETVLKPRLQKVIHSSEWKDGLPISKNSNRSIVKYIQLEQYDETLDNIAFVGREEGVQKRLDELEGYFLKYMLDYETKESPTRLSTEQLEDPFNYKIRTAKNGVTQLDVIETFNYLLGLNVSRVQVFVNGKTRYIAVFGSDTCKRIAIIWRPTVNLDLEVDKKFVEATILQGLKVDVLFVNGDSFIANAKPLEAEFKRLMGA